MTSTTRFILFFCLLVFTSCHSFNKPDSNHDARYDMVDSIVRQDPELALSQLETLSNKSNPKYYFYKGYALLMKHQYNEAEFEFEKALQVTSEKDSLYPRILFQHAKIKKLQSKFKESQKYLIQALSSPVIKRKLKAEANVVLGLISKDLGDFASADTFYNRALPYFIETRDSQNIALTYHNLASLYLSYTEDYERALDFAKKAIEYKSKLGDEKGKLMSMNTLAECYKNLKDFDKAISLQKSISYGLEQLHDSIGLAFSYLSLGDVYRYKKEYVKSKEYILKGYELFKKQGNYPLQFEVFKGLLASYFEKTGVPEGYYFEAYNNINDTLRKLNAENIQEETELAIQTAIALKQAELDKVSLEKTKAQKKLLQVQLILILIVSGLIVFVLYRLYKRYQLWLAEKELENKLLQENLEKVKVSEKEALERLLVLGQNMVENKDVFDHVLQELNAAKKTGSINTKEIELSIKNRHDKIDDRETFIFYLQKIQEGFMQNLKAKYPSLTETELKVCGLLSLNLNSKKIASLLNVEQKSVRMYQYRIRKKLDISGDDNLSVFLNSI